MITRRRLAFTALGLAAAIALTPLTARAQSSHVHLTKAVAETREAIHEGRQHMFSSFAEHTHNALDHATAVTGPDPNDHVGLAVSHLRQALKVAKRTHHVSRLEKGIHHAERALIHLKVAANR